MSQRDQHDQIMVRRITLLLVFLGLQVTTFVWFLGYQQMPRRAFAISFLLFGMYGLARHLPAGSDPTRKDYLQCVACVLMALCEPATQAQWHYTAAALSVLAMIVFLISFSIKPRQAPGDGHGDSGNAER